LAIAVQLGNLGINETVLDEYEEEAEE